MSSPFPRKKSVWILGDDSFTLIAKRPNSVMRTAKAGSRKPLCVTGKAIAPGEDSVSNERETRMLTSVFCRRLRPDRTPTRAKGEDDRSFFLTTSRLPVVFTGRNRVHHLYVPPIPLKRTRDGMLNLTANLGDLKNPFGLRQPPARASRIVTELIRRRGRQARSELSFARRNEQAQNVIRGIVLYKRMQTDPELPGRNNTVRKSRTLTPETSPQPGRKEEETSTADDKEHTQKFRRTPFGLTANKGYLRPITRGSIVVRLRGGRRRVLA